MQASALSSSVCTPRNKHAMNYDPSIAVRISRLHSYPPLVLFPIGWFLQRPLCRTHTECFAARASIEEDYSRKLMSLCRKPLGSHETGTLRTSLDTVRGEVELMSKQHQNIAAQMRSELEEPLAAFAGGMKERRKIVQNGIERLLKIKIQQTQAVNKVW